MFLRAEGTDSMIKASEREGDARDEDRDANVRELQQLIAIEERTRVQTRAVRTAYSLSHPFFQLVTIRERIKRHQNSYAPPFIFGAAYGCGAHLACTVPTSGDCI